MAIIARTQLTTKEQERCDELFMGRRDYSTMYLAMDEANQVYLIGIPDRDSEFWSFFDAPACFIHNITGGQVDDWRHLADIPDWAKHQLVDDDFTEDQIALAEEIIRGE